MTFIRRFGTELVSDPEYPEMPDSCHLRRLSIGLCSLLEQAIFEEDRMRKRDKGLWLAVVIVGILDLAAFISHAKVPDTVAASPQQTRPLKPPATGKVNVAFLISEGANVMRPNRMSS